jgi:hypothetical protein
MENFVVNTSTENNTNENIFANSDGDTTLNLAVLPTFDLQAFGDGSIDGDDWHRNELEGTYTPHNIQGFKWLLKQGSEYSNIVLSDSYVIPAGETYEIATVGKTLSLNGNTVTAESYAAPMFKLNEGLSFAIVNGSSVALSDGARDAIYLNIDASGAITSITGFGNLNDLDEVTYNDGTNEITYTINGNITVGGTPVVVEAKGSVKKYYVATETLDVLDSNAEYYVDGANKNLEKIVELMDDDANAKGAVLDDDGSLLTREGSAGSYTYTFTGDSSNLSNFDISALQGGNTLVAADGSS